MGCAWLRGCFFDIQAIATDDVEPLLNTTWQILEGVPGPSPSRVTRSDICLLFDNRTTSVCIKTVKTTLAYTSPFQTFPHLYLPSIIHTHSYYIILPSTHLLVWAKSYNTRSWEIWWHFKYFRFLASSKKSLGWFQVGITDQPPT